MALGSINGGRFSVSRPIAKMNKLVAYESERQAQNDLEGTRTAAPATRRTRTGPPMASE